MVKSQRPLLWGGVFLLLLLTFGFVLWDNGGLALYPGSGLQLLQRVGLVQFTVPEALWEHMVASDENLLVLWEDGSLASLGRRETGNIVLALTAAGEEMWRRGIPSGGQLRARGQSWLLTFPGDSELALYDSAGDIVWQQGWGWPLLGSQITPEGEGLVTLGPLEEARGNLLEKLVFVTGHGQAAWEHHVRNGTLLDIVWAPGSLGVNQLLFQKGTYINQFLLFDREGGLQGKWSLEPGRLFYVLEKMDKGPWVLGSEKTLCYFGDEREVIPNSHLRRSLQRLFPLPGRTNELLAVLLGDGLGSNSVVSYFELGGELLWERGFTCPAENLLLEVTPETIIVADEQGVYGIDYNGGTVWLYPAKGIADLAADPMNNRLLIYYETGIAVMLELPLAVEMAGAGEYKGDDVA